MDRAVDTSSTSPVSKPPTIRSDVSELQKRFGILSHVCTELVMEERPELRAKLLGMLAILTNLHDGASDDA